MALTEDDLTDNQVAKVPSYEPSNPYPPLIPGYQPKMIGKVPSRSGWVQVGTATTNSFSDSGLRPGKSYSYRIKSLDASGVLTVYSDTVSVTTPVS